MSNRDKNQTHSLAHHHAGLAGGCGGLLSLEGKDAKKSEELFLVAFFGELQRQLAVIGAQQFKGVGATGMSDVTEQGGGEIADDDRTAILEELSEARRRSGCGSVP